MGDDTCKQPELPTGNRELSLTRIIKGSPDKLFRAWTDPELMKLWFVPKPWSVADAQLDLRPGGSSLIVMRSPEGEEFPNAGIYLEVVPNRKLVFTDAYTSAWQPSAKPFFTGIITFEDLGDGTTRYTATAMHWTVEDCTKHEEMGFHEGWGQCATQLAELVATL